MIETNLKNILEKITVNPYGEKVTLVGAVKFQCPEKINSAIKAGLCDIGDNRVQEFKDKYEFIEGNPRRHFIGHLQTNKIKYLIGKVDLYHSVDRFELAKALSDKSAEKGVVSDILLQVNIGNESTKGGFLYEDAQSAYESIKNLPALKICGLMAMLPDSEDKELLTELAKKMRTLYDEIKSSDGNFRYLSMGMSGDFELCIQAGSNMVRLGTSIFGER